MKAYWALAALCTALGLSAASPAFAQADAEGDETAAPKAGPQSEYDRVLKNALDEFNLGNWTEARALFERAHELQPSARTLRAMGLTAFEEKSYALAISNLTAALDDARRPLTAKQRQEAQVAIERSRGFVAQYALEISPSDAQIQIDAHPPIILDGKLLLDPGTYTLLVSAEGHESAEQSIVARPREQRTLHIELPPQADKTDAPDEGGPRSGEEGLSTRQYIGIGVGAAGVIGLGLGTYFGLNAQSLDDDSGCVDGACPDAAAKQKNEDALTSARMATPCFIVGAAALVAAGFLFFWPSSPEQPPMAGGGVADLHLTPVVSDREAGIVASGRF